eukprot:5308625-Pyramimonas_sp.AAC.1
MPIGQNPPAGLANKAVRTTCSCFGTKPDLSMKVNIKLSTVKHWSLMEAWCRTWKTSTGAAVCSAYPRLVSRSVS